MIPARRETIEGSTRLVPSLQFRGSFQAVVEGTCQDPWVEKWSSEFRYADIGRICEVGTKGERTTQKENAEALQKIPLYIMLISKYMHVRKLLEARENTTR